MVRAAQASTRADASRITHQIQREVIIASAAGGILYGYGLTEVEGLEVPFEFVRVSVTPEMGLVTVLLEDAIVKGIVITKLLPKGFERESLYHVVNGVVRGTVKVDVESVSVVGDVNVNCALVMSRVVE